jgi:hypothetical protein
MLFPTQAQCFVMIPFREPFESLYFKIIQPAIESFGILCQRGDESLIPGTITNQIYKQIEAASLLIADVTGMNPNVSYELGIAHGLNKPVILISQSLDGLPFDYKAYRTVLYNLQDGQDLQKKIHRSIEALLNTTFEPVHRFFGQLEKEKTNFLGHLKEIYYQYEYTMTQENTYEVLDEKSAILHRKYTITPRTSMSHYFQIIRINKGNKANFKILSVKDTATNNDLVYLMNSLTDDELSFYILTRNLQQIGKSFMIEITVSCDYYFADMFGPKGAEYIGGMPLEKSKADYRSITEIIVFPDQPPFQQSYLKIIHDPATKNIGRIIKPQKRGKKKILSYTFTSGANEVFRSGFGFDWYLE